MSWSSQKDSSFLGRMTGIRSWMGLSNSLADVVMMAQEQTISPFGSRHACQRPAKAKGPPTPSRSAWAACWSPSSPTHRNHRPGPGTVVSGTQCGSWASRRPSQRGRLSSGYPPTCSWPRKESAPSACKHRSLTVTSRRNPPNTIRIFSSGAYLRLVAAFTLRTNDLVSSLRSWAASALLTRDWRSAPFMTYSTLVQELALPAQSLGFPNPLMCPICAGGLQWILNCSSGERRASRPVPPLLWDIAPGQTG